VWLSVPLSVEYGKVLVEVLTDEVEYPIQSYGVTIASIVNDVFNAHNPYVESSVFELVAVLGILSLYGIFKCPSQRTGNTKEFLFVKNA
jgi:hypothetical protein